MTPLLFDTAPCADEDEVLAAAEDGDPESARLVATWCASCPIAALCSEVLGGPVITPLVPVTVLSDWTARAPEATSKEVAA